MPQFITTCNRAYQPLLAALLNSMVRNSGLPSISFTVIEYDALDRAFLRSIGPSLTFIPSRALGEFRFNRALAENARHAQNYDKMLIWLLDAAGPLWYIDADVLCLNRLDGIDRYDHFSAVVCSEQIGTPTGAVRGYARNVTVFNAGVLCFRPSRETYGELEDWCQRYKVQHRHGDQLPLNEFFAERRPGGIQWMPLEWNCSIWTTIRQPYLFDLRSVKFLHYANEAKPGLHPPNKPAFEPLWDLWREYEVKR